MSVTIDKVKIKGKLEYTTPAFITHLRTYNSGLVGATTTRQDEFNELVETFATAHREYVTKRKEGPYSSSFDLKIKLLKLLHGIPTFTDLSDLITYVKHIPIMPIKRF